MQTIQNVINKMLKPKETDKAKPKFELKEYQKRLLSEIKEKFKTEDKVVLALCPGGGKTITAVQLVQEYAAAGKKILILSHGTEVLRKQWRDKFDELGIKYSEGDTKANVIIDLPQSLHRRDMPQVDLLIVDEAHEFYFAKAKKGDKKSMIKTILEKANPKKTLLLTGTPSKFVRKNFPMVVLGMAEIYKLPESPVGDLYIGLSSTTENIKEKDYTQDGELRANFKLKEVEDSMERLVDSIIDRVRVGDAKLAPEFWKKRRVNVKLSNKWLIFGKLEKTLISCHNIDQSIRVFNILKSKGIGVLLSHSDARKEGYDPDSSSIGKFQNDKDINVLIVVNRAILGFDMPHLRAVVDMTCSRNIDRIYQLMARVVRKSPENGPRKLFIKLSTDVDYEATKIYMSAVLHLMKTDFLSKYNGKNFKAMTIELSRQRREREKKGKSGRTKGKSEPTRILIDEALVAEVGAIELFHGLVNESNTVYCERHYARIGEVLEKLTGKKYHKEIKQVTEADLLHILKTGEVPESVYE